MIKKPKCLQYYLKIEIINKTLNRRQGEPNRPGVNITSSKGTRRRVVGFSTPHLQPRGQRKQGSDRRVEQQQPQQEEKKVYTAKNKLERGQRVTKWVESNSAIKAASPNPDQMLLLMEQLSMLLVKKNKIKKSQAPLVFQ
jgi:hypothetical protein